MLASLAQPRFYATSIATAIIALSSVLVPSLASAAPKACADLFIEAKPLRFQKTRAEVAEVKFKMPGMKVASITDKTMATGVTLFLFDKGATAGYDARGGSVAAVETTLLDEASYSNEIDGVLFAGGSTMGLEATQGVRRRIFKERAKMAGGFDFIPSVPGAVVYDFGSRVENTQDQLVYPTLNLGAAAFDNAKDGTMLIGRVGAGTSTTANKISGNLIWGGQGAAHKEVVGPKGEVFNIFTAVILNPHGDVTLPKGLGIDKKQLHALRGTDVPKGHKQNTTLSIVVTDLKLDRNQLRRLSMMVHTGMAAMIHPFHSYTDGDICFSVSTNKVDLPRGEEPGELEELLQGEASRLMKQAMVSSIKTANNAAGSKKATP